MSKQTLKITEQAPLGNLKKGFIHIDISDARIISSNDIANSSNVTKNTDPILERENGATDKALRLSWASASVIEISMPPIMLPPDFDPANPLILHVLAKMKAASVDTPVIAVGFFMGIGDTNAGGNTAALSTSLQDLKVTVAAADVAAGYPNPVNTTLKPGTHSTASNDVYVYGMWAEYTRKA